jgi:hypothetical protein
MPKIWGRCMAFFCFQLENNPCEDNLILIKSEALGENAKHITFLLNGKIKSIE